MCRNAIMFIPEPITGWLVLWVHLWDQIPSVMSAAWGVGRDRNKIEFLLGRIKGRIDSGKTTNNIHLCVLCSKKLPCSFFSFLYRSLHYVIEIMLDPVLIVERDNLWPTHSKCTKYCDIFRLTSLLLPVYALTLIFLLPYLSGPFLIHLYGSTDFL